VSGLDIGDIDQMAGELVARGLVRMDGEVVIIDAGLMGIDKVLGGGRVTRKMIVSAQAFSERAKTKIEEMGGQAMTV